MNFKVGDYVILQYRRETKHNGMLGRVISLVPTRGNYKFKELVHVEWLLLPPGNTGGVSTESPEHLDLVGGSDEAATTEGHIHHVSP